MNFFSSVDSQCLNGNKNKRVCRPFNARIVVSSVTLSSGVRFRGTFTVRIFNVFVDQLDLGMGQLFNSLWKRNEDSDIILVFFVCHLVSSLQKRYLLHKSKFPNRFLSFSVTPDVLQIRNALLPLEFNMHVCQINIPTTFTDRRTFDAYTTKVPRSPQSHCTMSARVFHINHDHN